MPHGSGGGSHSGGSHSSSHSSSHGGSHGGSHGPRMSRKPFPHCRRFRYYDRYGMSHYMYSEAPPQPQSLLSLIITLFFFAPFVIAGAALVFFTIGSMLPPKPLTQDYISNGIYIEDNAYVLDDNVLSDDMTELNESLRKFKELTGIEPHIITVYDSDWENHYNSLENYAYDLYVNRFSDEKHFLIVYSEPENA